MGNLQPFPKHFGDARWILLFLVELFLYSPLMNIGDSILCRLSLKLKSDKGFEQREWQQTYTLEK